MTYCTTAVRADTKALAITQYPIYLIVDTSHYLIIYIPDLDKLYSSTPPPSQDSTKHARHPQHDGSCPNISSNSLFIKQIDLHNSPAEEADPDHDKPARDGTNGIEDITRGDEEAVLGEPAVGRVEGTRVRGDLLVLLLGVDLVDGIRGDIGRVQPHGVKIDDGMILSKARLGDFEVVDGRATSGPHGAEDLVRFTVEISQIGRGRVSRQEKDGLLSREKEKRGLVSCQTARYRPPYLRSPYIERLVRLATATEASLVSTRDVHHPILRLRRRLEKRLPVAQVELRDGLLLNLLLFDQLLDGRNDRGGGRQIRLGLVEPSLNAITEGNLLLRRSKRWEEREELDETHDAKKTIITTR